MTDDIAPALLKKARAGFNARLAADRTLQDIAGHIGDGTATAQELGRYAERTGEALRGALRASVTPEALPDGRMYYNIANRVLPPLLEQEHDLVAQAAADTYTALNRAEGLGIRGQKPELDRDRVDGLVELACSRDQYAEMQSGVERGAVNFAQHTADEAARVNAEFAYQAGLSPKLERECAPGGCQYCQDLAGKYEYPAPKEVYTRHKGCTCGVYYTPAGSRRRQNAHTKRWEEEHAAEKEERIKKSEEQENNYWVQKENDRRERIESSERKKRIEEQFDSSSQILRLAKEGNIGLGEIGVVFSNNL